MVDRADINGVLTQMRAIRSQMNDGAIQGASVQGVTNPINPQNAVEKSGFGEVFKHAIDQVNNQQAYAKKLATAYEMGDKTVDLPQVMISMEKASTSFDAMTQVRNRLVSAYEDIMQMPI